MSYAKLGDLGSTVETANKEAIQQNNSQMNQTQPSQGPHLDIEIKDKNQKDFIINNHRIVVVDIYAEWCQPCKQIESRYYNMAQKYNSKQVVLLKENIEKNMTSGIMGVPAFQFYKDGVLVDTVTGADLESVNTKLNTLLNSL
jgi:thioredoxin 1